MPDWVIGLVGVVVGGLLTGVVGLLLELLRERREARAAKRVVRAELEAAAGVVDGALTGEKPEWPPGWDRVGWIESWATYRPVLAKSMKDADFERLASAYLQMQLLQTGFAAGQRGISDRDQVFFETVKSAVSDAQKVLPKA